MHTYKTSSRQFKMAELKELKYENKLNDNELLLIKNYIFTTGKINIAQLV
jgi:hypothetical protein